MFAQTRIKYDHWSNENSHERMEINPSCARKSDYQSMPRAFLYTDSFCNRIRDFNILADRIYLCKFESHNQGNGRSLSFTLP